MDDVKELSEALTQQHVCEVLHVEVCKKQNRFVLKSIRYKKNLVLIFSWSYELTITFDAI